MNGIALPAGLFVALTAVVTVVAAVRGTWSPCGLSMISAINPISERSRGHRFWLTSTWFIAGAVLGGAVLGVAAAVGAAVWSLLPATAATSAAVAAACCLLAAASDTSLFGFRLPEHPRQVNERWLGRYRRWVYAAGFGVQIGCGFATYIMTAAVYLAAALAVVSGSPVFAVAVGLLFGLVRGSAVLLSAGVRDPAGLQQLHRRLDRLAPWSLRAAIFAEMLAVAGFGWIAAGLVGLSVSVVVLAVGVVVTKSGRFAAGATLATNEEKSCLSRR